MVEDSIPATGGLTGAAPDGAVVTVVYDRIRREMNRFLRTDNTGETVYSPFALAELVTEILADIRAQRAALWQLLKDRVRAVIVADQYNSDLYLANTDLRAEITRLQGELQAAQRQRDEFAREARVREADVLDVIDERDRAQAQLDELDTVTATAGGR